MAEIGRNSTGNDEDEFWRITVKRINDFVSRSSAMRVWGERYVGVALAFHLS